MLQLNEVTKAFGDHQVIQGVNLQISTAETTVMIGPSGCGKSTLLRLMLGLLKPTAGDVLFDGENLSQVSARRMRELRMRAGYVIQDGGLFPHMTSYENITLMAHREGWSRDRINSRLEELTKLTDFPSDRLDRYPVEISGGQRQRVALMRALMLDPEYLLFDEPLGALDPMIRFDLQQDLHEIFNALDKTVVMVTHDLAEAAYFADSIVLLRDGEVVQQGGVKELFEQPADEFVSQFVNAQRGQSLEEAAGL